MKGMYFDQPNAKEKLEAFLKRSGFKREGKNWVNRKPAMTVHARIKVGQDWLYLEMPVGEPRAD